MVVLFFWKFFLIWSRKIGLKFLKFIIFLLNKVMSYMSYISSVSIMVLVGFLNILILSLW